MGKMWYNNIKRIKNERFDKNPVCFPGLSSPSNGNDMPQNTNAPHGYPPCGAIFLVSVKFPKLKSGVFGERPVNAPFGGEQQQVISAEILNPLRVAR